MRRNIEKSNVLILGIIFLGFFVVIASFYIAFYDLFKQEIKTVSQISAEHIEAQINNIINLPLNVSITMANDTFLREFILAEENLDLNREVIPTLWEYLDEYHKEYNFDSVFFVSAKTNHYYHFENGLDRTLHKGNQEDAWLFDFLESDKPYAFHVDKDQVGHDNVVTIFVNCKLMDTNGEAIGVVGVGVTSPYVQDFLTESEENYDVSSYLIDESGHLILSSHHTAFDAINLFDEPKFKDIDLSLQKENPRATGTLWYHDDFIDGYVITKYIPHLNWYLVVEKTTTPFMAEMSQQMLVTSILGFVSISLVGLIISNLMRKHNREVILASQMDNLTNIRNRDAYMHELSLHEKRLTTYQSFALSVVDLNNLKKTNDTYGHQAGDELLQALSSILCAVFKHSPVFRIGGDEFVIILIDTDEAATKALWSQVEAEFSHYNLTQQSALSAAFGYAFFDSEHLNTMDLLFQAADDAMYRHKQQMKESRL